MDSELRFFDPFAAIEKSGHALPHWQQPHATYFLTFRLADAIPAAMRREFLQQRAAWLEHHPVPWSAEAEREYHRRFSAQMDRWLDAGHGACVLRNQDCRQVLAEALRFGAGTRYHLHAWVIMPNHAHILASMATGAKVNIEVGGWKSISAKRINRLAQRPGRLWQANYFDRIIRDGEHFTRCVRYIRNNPLKANLPADQFTLEETALAQHYAPPTNDCE